MADDGNNQPSPPPQGVADGVAAFLQALQDPTQTAQLVAALAPAVKTVVEEQHKQQAKIMSTQLDVMRFNLQSTLARQSSHRQVHDEVNFAALGGRGKGLGEQHKDLTEVAELYDRLVTALEAVHHRLKEIDDDHMVCVHTLANGLGEGEGQEATDVPSMFPPDLLSEIEAVLQELITRNAARRRTIRLAAAHPKGTFAAAQAYLDGTPDFTAKELGGFGDFLSKQAKLSDGNANGATTPSKGGGKKGGGGGSKSMSAKDLAALRRLLVQSQHKKKKTGSPQEPH